MIARLLDPSTKDAYLPSVESYRRRPHVEAHCPAIQRCSKPKRKFRHCREVYCSTSEYTAVYPRTDDSASHFGSRPQLNEVDQFFRDPEESVRRDVLEFRSMSESRYSTLYRIAKDVLAAQASSVPSESAFSGGGRYVTILRNRLEPEALQAVLCLNCWTVVFAAMVAMMTDDK